MIWVSSNVLSPILTENDLSTISTLLTSLSQTLFNEGFRRVGDVMLQEGHKLEEDEDMLDEAPCNMVRPEREANFGHICTTLDMVTGTKDYTSLLTLHPM